MSIKRTFGFQWHLTEKCDQKCKHCYSVSEQKRGIVQQELNKEQYLAVMDNILDFCNKIDAQPGFSITGGDPLLCNHFWDVAECLKANDIPFTILGNPFHLNEDVCNELFSLGCWSYQMSLDGLRDTHDSIRKKGSFDITMQNFELLKSAGIKTSAMNTVTAYNFHDLIKLIYHVVDAKIDSFAFARYVPVGVSDSLGMISSMEYKNLLENVLYAYDKLVGKGTSFSLKEHLFKLLLWEKGLYKPSIVKKVNDGCNCGISQCAILPDGQVFACRRFSSYIGNVIESSLENIFYGNEMSQYRQIEHLKGCCNCELLYDCRGCHAVSHGVSGDYFEADPQCWRFD